MPSFPPLTFLTSDAQATDYRLAIGPEGTTVIFERTLAGQPTVLYRLTGVGQPETSSPPSPQPFLSGSGVPRWQTRPDWCWKTDRIAFNGVLGEGSVLSVLLVGSDGVDPSPVPDTERFSYPTWGRDGDSLVTENASSSASPIPSNSIFDAQGTVSQVNIDGLDSVGVQMFGGMPTVGPEDLPQIAYAGQPAIPGWGGGSGSGPRYDQSANYIFFNSSGSDGYTSAPMEPGASVTGYDPAFQARAPAWSPDGSTIAFESTRTDGRYAIYLFDVDSSQVTQVTDPSLGAQHAKFFPCGTKLILSAFHPGGQPSTRGIAWVDISSLLPL